MKTSIRSRLLVPALCALALFVLAYSFFWANRYADLLSEAFETESGLAASFVAPSLTEALWDFNDDGVASSLAGLEAVAPFTFAVVVMDGQVSARSSPAEVWNDDWDAMVTALQQDETQTTLTIADLTVSRRLLTRNDGETLVGELYTAFSDASIAARLQQANASAATIGVIAFVIFATVLVMSANTVSRPTRRIVAKLDALTAGDTRITVPEAERKDELGQLGRAVNSFRDTLIQTKTLEAQGEELRAAQDRVVAILSEGLEQLANCNLSFELTDDFPEDHRKLRDDFAQAASRLRDAIATARQSSEVILTDIDGFAKTANHLSTRSSEDSAELRETAQSINALATSALSTRDMAASARNSAGVAGQAAHDGENVINETISAMDKIQASSAQIATITDVIDEIAFQTNLLALNAGVEAARAGEAGRSFGIVATEVRALAQRTADAAGQIKGLIQNSRDHVAQGAELVAESSGALEKVLAAIKDIGAQVDDISGSAVAQSDQLRQIDAAIGQLDHRARDNAGQLQSSANDSEALRDKSLSLLHAMEQFRLDLAAPAGTARAA